MPRVTIAFNLPAEAARFRDAIDGEEMASILRAIDELCRRTAKDAETAWVSRDVLNQIRDMIPWELINPCEFSSEEC